MDGSGSDVLLASENASNSLDYALESDTMNAAVLSKITMNQWEMITVLFSGARALSNERFSETVAS